MPQFAPINCSASGANTVVAAQTGRKIGVIGMMLVAGGSVNATVESSGGSSLTGPIPLPGASFILPHCPVLAARFGHHFETLAGEGLVVSLDGAVQVSGFVVYEYLF